MSERDKLSEEIISGVNNLVGLLNEADPGGIPGLLAFILLIQCENLCDKLRLRISETETSIVFGEK